MNATRSLSPAARTPFGVTGRACTALSAVLAACLPPAAHAQTSSMLEEIVVTAERRELSLQDTPSSILAFTQESLESKQVDDIQDLQAFVPNLSVGGGVPTGQAGPDFAIRGISAAHGRIGAEKGVALYIDDLYYPRQVGSLLRLADVERVEVLRGPQGTLFGRNATGGAVRYIMRRPSEDWEGRVSATYGTNERIDIVGMLNAPLGDKAALRLHAGKWEQDGYIDVYDRNGNLIHDSGNIDDVGYRAALRLTPTEDLTIDISASRTESDGIEPAPVITAFYAQGLAPGATMPTGIGPAGANLAGYQAFLQRNGLPLAVAGDARQLSPDDETRLFACHLDQATPIAGDYVRQDELCRLDNHIENTVVSLDVNYRISDAWSVRYIGGLMDGEAQSADALFGNIISRFTNTWLESYSHELQVNFSADRINGVVGLYYFNETPREITGIRQFTPAGPFAGASVSALEDFSDLETTSKAVFANFDYAFTDRLTMILGARYSKDDKEVILGDNDPAGGLLPQPGGNLDYDGDGVTDSYINDDTFNSTDWRVTGRYSISDDIMVYGTVSTGFKAGGFAADLIFWLPVPTCSPVSQATCVPTDSPVLAYDSEDLLNYELGVKADWFDGRLRTNVSGFLMKYENYIVQFANFNKPTSGRPELVMINGGDADISGLEANLSWLVFDELTFNASFGYTDVDWQTLSPYSDLYDQASCPGVGFFDLTVDNCGTLDTKRTPKYSYTLGLDYSKALPSGTVSAGLNYGWTDETETNNGTNSWRADAYGITNLRVQYKHGDSWVFSAFGSNIFDEKYALSGLVQNGGQPVYTDSVVYGRGAEWGVTVEYRY